MYHQDYDHFGNAFLRLQVLLIAFSFGAIIEGTSGFGTPVAYGAIGTPIVTLAAVSGLDQLTLSTMVGRQLPWVSLLVPFWLVVAFVKMERGTWKEAFEVWPAALVSGGSFAIMQHYASSKDELRLMTDVVSGVVSVVATALFLRYVTSDTPGAGSSSGPSARPRGRSGPPWGRRRGAGSTRTPTP